MKEELKQLKLDALKAIEDIKNSKVLEELEVQFLGRKNGEMTRLMKGLKDLEGDTKKAIGILANEVKKAIEGALGNKRQEITQVEWEEKLKTEKLDISQPSLPKKESGSLHPNTIVQRELEDIFTSMGFMVLDGPELESDYYNFQALNIPESHPARDSHDTFFIKGNKKQVMRTQTSPVQIRAMQKYGAPLRVVVPGKCFRNEAIDASHDHTFYQLEGLLIDKDISVAHLIGVMKELLQGVLKREVEIRLRPGHFPFVEPGFELDMKCLVCGGKGCGACSHSGWVETVPCGLVHPEVIKAGGLDPKEWSGFAFGLGMTRLVMQKYGIHDIRLLTGGDLRFLKQF